jgi:cystathionine beta-synthase
MSEDPAGAPDRVIVVILPDGGRSYLSKLYNDEWMRANGLLDRPGAVTRVAELLAARHHGPNLPDLVLARTTERVGDVIDRLQEFGISQMPVSEAPDGDAIASIVGAIAERGLLDRAYRDPSVVERTVGEVMDRPLPIIDVTASLDDAFGLLAGPASALLAVRTGRPAGIVTKLDLLEYLTHHAA